MIEKFLSVIPAKCVGFIALAGTVSAVILSGAIAYGLIYAAHNGGTIELSKNNIRLDYSQRINESVTKSIA